MEKDKLTYEEGEIKVILEDEDKNLTEVGFDLGD